MKPLPLELRQRIVDAIDQQLGSYAEIAEMFGVSERYLYKLLALRRTMGDLAPKPHGGGAVAKIKDEQVLDGIDLVAEQPDATLDELRQRIKSKLRVAGSIATVSNVLARWGLPRKKKSRSAKQADPQAQAAFQQRQPRLPSARLSFVDEFAIQLNMTRTHARAPLGVRATVTESWERGPHYSVIGALGLRGLCASMMLEGAFDQAAFDAFVEHLLVPQLAPGDQVWCDRVRFHFSSRAQALIEGAGARLEHLPTYSPHFNPIEECISKIKALLRTWSAATERRLRQALKKAIARILPSDIRGWFTHCGYV